MVAEVWEELNKKLSSLIFLELKQKCAPKWAVKKAPILSVIGKKGTFGIRKSLLQSHTISAVTLIYKVDD